MSTRNVELHRLRQLLGDLRKDERYTPGEPLHRVQLSSRQEIALRGCVRQLLADGVGRLDRADRSRWGAAMLLLGARALRQESEGPFTYSRMGETLCMPDLEGRLGAIGRDAMDAGARCWGIEILRIEHKGGSRRRQFLRTMLRHSGGGWAILERLAEHVAGRWSFASVLRADLDTVVGWIDDRVQRGELGQKLGDALRGLETHYAMAERLQDVATAWALVREELDAGLDAGDITPEHAGPDVLTRSSALGIGELLDAPDQAAEQRMVQILFPAATAIAGGETRIRWRWRVDSRGRHALVIELPAQMRLPGLPRSADRVRARVIAGRSDERCIYTVQDGMLRHLSGTRFLSLPDDPDERVTVIAEYRQGQTIGEIELDELDLRRPVAMFRLDTGRITRRAAAGSEIVLVPPPGWILEELLGFWPDGQGAWHGWLGTMPDEPTPCTLHDPDGHRTRWTLVPAGIGLDVTLDNAIDRLRLDGALVTCGPPVFATSQITGALDYRVENRDDRAAFQGRAGIRGARLRLPGTWRPGRYCIEVQRDAETRRVDLVVLPESARFAVRSEADRSAVTLSGCPRAQVQVRGSARPGSAKLMLGSEHRGPVVLEVTIPLDRATLVGTWCVWASPMTAAVVATRDGDPVAERDIAILRGGGGLSIHGPPRSSVEVRFRDEVRRLRLPGHGHRFVPFVWLPGRLFRDLADRRLEVEVRWADGACKQLSFVDSSARPLQHHGLHGEADETSRERFLCWPHTTENVLHVEAVAAWQPWKPAHRLPVRPAERAGEPGCAVTLDVPPGPYQATVMCGDRRISGMGLIWCNVDSERAEPPPELIPLERELWRPTPHRGRLAEFLQRRLEQEGDDAILAGIVTTLQRYGTSWFRIAEVLVPFLGTWRLRSLLDDSWELGDAVEFYYQEMGVPWLFIRHRDLVAMGQWLDDHAQSANQLLVEVGDLRAGLLVSAVDAWASRLDLGDEEQARLLAPLYQASQLYRKAPGSLGHDDLDRLRESGELLDALDAVDDEIPAYSQRLLGLLELRSHVDLILAEPESRWLLEAPMATCRTLEDRWFVRLPGRLESLERAIASIAWHIHSWRRGAMRYHDNMRMIGKLESLARYSFDYWLNTWDAMHQGAL